MSAQENEQREEDPHFTIDRETPVSPHDRFTSIHHKPVRLWETVLVVALAFVADFCLYEAPGGPGLAAVLLLAGFSVRFAIRQTEPVRCLRLLLTLLLVAIGSVWRSWWLLSVVGWSTLFLLAVRRTCPRLPIMESAWAAAMTLPRCLFRVLGHVGALVDWSDAKREQGKGPKVPFKVIAIPAGVVVVFCLIFAAANPVVGRLMEGVSDTVGDWVLSFGDNISIFRIFVWLFWFTLFAGLLRPALRTLLEHITSKRSEALPIDGYDDDPWNMVIAVWTLALVNVLFAAYNAMDAVYLYVKAELPEGISWTDYTHAGCGWLTLGLLLSTLVLGYTFAGGMNFHPRTGRLKLLAYIWVAQNAVLAIGALRRIHMYVDYSGLTHLRLTGIYGSLLVMAGLAIMTRKVRFNRSNLWLCRRYVASFFAAIALLALTPNDWVCSTYNLSRVQAGDFLALRPMVLKRLSPEALPALIDLLEYENQEDDPEERAQIVRDGITAILGMQLRHLESAVRRPWSQQQLSAHWAYKQLKPLESTLRERVPPSQWMTARATLFDHLGGHSRFRDDTQIWRH